jgi:AcrR family transcriptional regulator
VSSRAAARETRRLVTDAAARLFVARGYAATSMRDIATAAEVADKTLYLIFGSKAELLRAVADQAVAGDDEPVPVAERRWFKDILATSDSRQARTPPRPRHRPRLDPGRYRAWTQRNLENYLLKPPS